MPDGLFHIAAADLAGRCRSRELPHLLLGAILPDLISRPAARFLPRQLDWAVHALHAPAVVALLALAYLLIAVPEARRRRAGRALLLGAFTHYALDALQIEVRPGYFWLFPFSWVSGNLGIFWPEQSLTGLPFLLGAVAAWRLGGPFVARHRPAAGGPARVHRRDRSPRRGSA